MKKLLLLLVGVVSMFNVIFADELEDYNKAVSALKVQYKVVELNREKLTPEGQKELKEVSTAIIELEGTGRTKPSTLKMKASQTKLGLTSTKLANIK